MTSIVQLKLFGSPQISYQGQPLTGFVSTKVRALLIYLAVTARPHSRDHLAELLWADTLASTRTNLRKALSNLRQLIGAVLVEDAKDSITLNPQQLWVDVVEFGRLSQQGSVQEAVALYHADFLTGFNLSLSYEFEAWALSEQSRLKSQMVDLLRRLTTQHTSTSHSAGSPRHALTEAIQTVRRLLVLEPWHEEAHRWLMTLLAKDGQRSAALAHFEICKRVLQEELAVAPSAETLQLVEEIQRATLPVARPSAKATPMPSPEFPLIGRDGEWAIIQTAWQKVLQHGVHFVAIAGEAGIGKTRLTEEARHWVAQQGYTSVYARSYAAEGALAYSPVIDWLRSDGIKPTLQHLEAVWLQEVARLLPELLTEYPHLSAPPSSNDGTQRRRFFEALARAICLTEKPRLLVMDDLHWCDHETLEWLRFLLRFDPKHPLLIIGTYRTEEVDRNHPLQTLLLALHREELVSEVELGLLNALDTSRLSSAVAAKNHAHIQADELWQITAGHPLFVIETICQQDQKSNNGALPRKVKSIIQSRFANLSAEAHHLALIAAVIGHSFTLAFLTKCSQITEAEALDLLAELWARRVIQVQGADHYDFYHDFMREVAYTEISPTHRSQFHQQVAHALIDLHVDNVLPVSGEIAVHFERAKRIEQSVTYYRYAADHAKQLYAHSETVHYRQKALQLVQQLSTAAETGRQHIDLLHELGRDRTLAKGRGNLAVGEAWIEAYTLAKKSGTPRQLVQAQLDLSRYYRDQGNWSLARQYAQEGLTLAQMIEDAHLIAKAGFELASVLWHQGRLTESRTYFEQVQAWSKSTTDDPSLQVTNLFRYSQCLWLLGFPEQARLRMMESLQLTYAAFPDDECTVLNHYATVLYFCRDVTMVAQVAQELVEKAPRLNEMVRLFAGKLYQGWSLAHDARHEGAAATGLSLIRSSLTALPTAANKAMGAVWVGIRTEVSLLAGEGDHVAPELELAITTAQATTNCFWLAHLLKVRGDLYRYHAAPLDQIEASYQEALAVAQGQHAKSLELRAAISLCRLWHQQGKSAEAYHLLAPIYGWFTEGFDTPDLIEAKQLLDELAE